MSVWKCPVCGGALRRAENRLVCPRGHSYDLARQGYVNLLNSNSGAQHGDSREMVQARSAFLDAGWYAPLREELCALLVPQFPAQGVLLDAGCGEGYYTSYLYDKIIRNGKKCDAFGVDISREALKAAHRRCPALELAVGSVFSLPAADGSCDAVLNLFAPYVPQEFARVLKPKGVLVRAFALERHLWELKQAVYDRPYENRIGTLELPGFSLAEVRRVEDVITLEGHGQIESLFGMTPYCHRTSAADRAKLDRLQTLTTRTQFCAALYRRK